MATRKLVTVRIGGRDRRVRIAEVRPRGRRRFAWTPDLIKRASSPLWYWALERPLADAFAQALIDAGAAEGVKDGHTLVETLRARDKL